MVALLCFVLAVLASPLKSKSRLEAENVALRQQLIVLRRKVQGRVRLTNNDRWFFIQLYRWFPSILHAITIIRPETLVRWHRAGFRCYWRWKSRSRGGRPKIETDLRALIRRMSMENPLWGAPRIHGELLKLGFEVAQSSVAKYMVKRRAPPSQGWRTFLRNHAPDIAAMDLFIAPTIGFDLLYAFVIVRLNRRSLVWINVTANPTAEWIARQITEAFPWDDAPQYLVPSYCYRDEADRGCDRGGRGCGWAEGVALPSRRCSKPASNFTASSSAFRSSTLPSCSCLSCSRSRSNWSCADLICSSSILARSCRSPRMSRIRFWSAGLPCSAQAKLGDGHLDYLEALRNWQDLIRAAPPVGWLGLVGRRGYHASTSPR